ncbi:helix-turn-helix domain-containing protein [Enterococcus rotai]|uniref:helix-turn-helix domain-containing protein n=1 Tax=Enterococcus rotai TaxID=118060 RepID=UPI0035C6F595
MTVFERIKFLAKQRSKTLKKVTTDLGYSENYFYSLKSGKQPSAEKLTEIADYFDVSVDYLLGREEKSKSDSSMAKQVMMRMDTDGLSKKEIDEIESEMERFFSWRIEEIKKERENNK